MHLAVCIYFWLSNRVSAAGLGLANLAGGAFSAYPTVGGFSRSAVNADSGAVSGMQQLALMLATPDQRLTVEYVHQTESRPG